MTEFPTDPAGLPEASGPAPLELAGGDTLDLRVGPVAKRLGDTTVRMLGYNGSIPGPTLKVRQGAEIRVDVTNHGDLDTTVHWHGLRLRNMYDGVPHETQAPIPVGGEFSYSVQFPDPGLYWYHPHVREDYTQELGLYGNILVEPAEPGYWPPVDREFVLTLDDVLVEGGAIAPFSTTEVTHVAMGRYGTVLLVAGETDLRLAADAGDVARLWLTNTANTRVFNVRLPGARMKLVGGDSGRVEREELVEEVLLAPSERAVVDVLFERPGELALEHHTPGQVHHLATVTVSDGREAPAAAERFGVLREAPELRDERQLLGRWIAAPPDKVLALVAEMDDVAGHGHEHHHGHGHHHAHGHHAGHDGPDGIEWEDEMAEVNRLTTTANMRWRIVDCGTGAAGAAIDWRFTVGERVKIRLVNEMDSAHPMHHPFHIHGAGRFLVLTRDGAAEPNLVWKDAVLIRTGQVVDILLDVTNPGLWMAHCHIAEHMQGGMMFSFEVTRE